MSDLHELYKTMSAKEYAKAVIEARKDYTLPADVVKVEEKIIEELKPVRHIPWEPRFGNPQQEEPIGDYRRFMWRANNRKE